MPIQVEIAVTAGDFPHTPLSAAKRHGRAHARIGKSAHIVVHDDGLIGLSLAGQNPRRLNVPTRKLRIGGCHAAETAEIAIYVEAIIFALDVDTSDITDRFESPQRAALRRDR